MDQLTQQWMPTDDTKKLDHFYSGIDQFLQKMLPNQNSAELDSSKIIADPLLGYIYFTPLEIAIIDTELFQRLRKIKQLGLAHLVFPSLSYSRFEHSLGVLGRLNQILNKLIENYGRANKKDDSLNKIIRDYSDSLRLSALMHDVGHCIFSHCSERVIHSLDGDETYPSTELIRQSFTSHFEKENTIPIAEVFSIAIIGSKRFHDFVQRLELFKHKEVTTILENCARFILGLPVKNEPETVFLMQLISSGLDVDKIDYMVREQHYSGIKLEIDLDRILSKLNVFDLNYFELPKHLDYLKKIFSAESKYKVLGFSKGGQFVFEEFCIARLALNVKIYLHQKVRAAESQLSTCLESISKNTTLTHEKELQHAHNWLMLSESLVETQSVPTSLFNDNASGLFSNSFSLTPNQTEKLKKIDARVLCVRAYAFGQINSFSETQSNPNSINEKIYDFFEQFDEAKLKYLKEEIIKEAIKINGLYGSKFSNAEINEIIVDVPKLRFKSIQQGHESLYFERPFLSPLKWTIPLDKIVVYFEENRALGYVFASKDVSPIINIASEIVIFNISMKVFNQEGNISKHTYKEAAQLKKWLSENNYYKTIPQLREISGYLKNAEAAEKIQKIHEKLDSFESLKKERITINKIMTFVNQFPFQLQSVCLDFLMYLEIYDERQLGNEIERVFEKIGDAISIGVSFLGAVSDSGGKLSYNLRDIFEKRDLKSKEIDDGLIINSDVLVIYDDNINSGLQLLNIMAELCDEKDLLGDHHLEEKHVGRLTNQVAIDKLKTIPIHFCFIVGSEGVEEKITQLLVEKLNFISDNIHIHICFRFKNDEKIFSGPNSKFQHEKKIELREFLTNTAEQLLSSDGKAPEKTQNRQLGYANAEAMVLFPYNIPTMTITALWHNGTLTDGQPWIPIAERRRRTKNGNIIGED